MTTLTSAAHAAPLGQADTPTLPASETPTPATTATPTQTVSPTATATPTLTPAPTLTPSSEFTGRPMPAAPPITGPARTVSRETVLTTLRLSHPRLLLLTEDEVRIRRALSTDVTARSFRDAMIRNGARILTQPTPERVLIGPRMLTVSRTVLERVTTLALLYRLDGDPRWAQRARAELLAAAGFTDWNPSHFLDVAEMCHAFALGYDWLYDFLTRDERTTIRTALIEKGLRPAEQAYAAQASWVRATHNWNIVCNGGIIIGALAIADEEPGLAGTLLAQALASLPTAIATYAPDGAWPEGAAYWEYATLYLVSAVAALTSALGTDFDLSDAPGLSATGRFRLHVAGPTGLFFNFADAGARAGDAPVLFWLARRYDDQTLTAGAREAATGRASARDLLWYDTRDTPAELTALPLDARYQAAQLAFFRSAWNDKDAIYVGFKGGDNATNHTHLDLGTFVLDALGQRWAVDLGPDDYDLPGYFSSERWTYERLKTSGQNTLTLNGENQDLQAKAPLTMFRSEPDGGLAIADLTAAYAPSGATKVQRGISLRDNRSRVLLQDEVEASEPVDLTWTMHTQAAVEIQGNRAILRQGGATLEAQILSPDEAMFTLEEVEMPPPQRPAVDLRRLLVRLPEVAAARLAILFTPRRGVNSAAGAVNTPAIPTTSPPLTPNLNAAPADNLPPPEIIDLSRWASSEGPILDGDIQT